MYRELTKQALPLGRDVLYDAGLVTVVANLTERWRLDR
jgi:hypothetical protein